MHGFENAFEVGSAKPFVVPVTMSAESFTIVLSDDPIVPDTHTFEAEEGGEVQFLGVVRSTEDGRPIRGIEYTAYREMAENELRELVKRAAARFQPHRAHLRHRLGFVAAGEPSIIIRVSTKHSGEAFELCRWYLSQIKTTVPIWKKPIWAESS